MSFTLLNAAYTTLASPVANGSVTTITVATGTGSRFSAATATTPIRCVIVDTTTSPETVKEFVDVTGVSTDTLTVLRAVEDTTRFPAAAISAGVTIAAVATAAALSGPVHLGQGWTDTAIDAGSAVQAMLDADGTAVLAGPGARGVYVDSGVIYGTFALRPGTQLRGWSGQKSVLRAKASQTAAVLDYATHDAYHTKVTDLRIDGNKAGGATCRGIDMSSSNSDAYALAIPNSNGAADYGPGGIYGNYWLNSQDVLQDVSIQHVGGDYGLYVGRNKRAARIRGVYIEDCTNAAVRIVSENVQEIIGLIAGNSGDGIVIAGDTSGAPVGDSTISLTNCFSWYHGRSNTGNGNGYTVNVQQASGVGYGGPQMTDCVDGDVNGVGIKVLSARFMQVRGHQSSGAATAVLQIGGTGALGVVTGGTFDIALTHPDNNFTTPVGVILDGTVTAPNTNKVRLSLDPSSTLGNGWAPLVIQNGATLLSNDIEVCYGGCEEGTWNQYAGSGTVNPDPALARVHRITQTGNLTIGPVSVAVGYRMRVGITITPDGTHTIAWDASYGSAPAVNPTGGTQTFWFRNIATTTATPVWSYEGPSAAPAVKVGRPATTLSIPGQRAIAVGTPAITAAFIFYAPWHVDKGPITIDELVCEVTTAGTSGGKARLGLCLCDTSWVPTSLVVDAGEVAIDTTGVKVATTGLPLVLAPGRYLSMLLASVNFNARSISCASPDTILLSTLGASPLLNFDIVAQTYGPLPSSPPAPTSSGGSNNGFAHMIFGRVSVP